jgi:hypothetical protein
MRRQAANVYELPWLLLCEGPGDHAVLWRLIDKHVGTSNFQVEYVGGNGGFANRLALLRDTSQTFNDNVKAVLIVADKDEDAEESFRAIAEDLGRVGFPKPTQPSVVGVKTGYPAVVVLMIPIRTEGNLETLCLPAMLEKWPIKRPLDDFIAATPASGWGIGKKSKARMNALLATVCESKPDVSFHGLWDQNCSYHLPLDHDCFEELVRFLKNFPSIITPRT